MIFAAPAVFVAVMSTTFILSSTDLRNISIHIYIQLIAAYAAGFVAFLGLRSAKHRFRNNIGSRSLLFIGSFVNVLFIVFALGLSVLQIYTITSPGIGGTVTANGEPVEITRVLLGDRCLGAAARVEQYGYSASCWTMASRVANVISPGFFSYWGVEPGDYHVDVDIDPPRYRHCRVMTPHARVTPARESLYGSSQTVVTNVEVESGFLYRAKVNIELYCSDSDDWDWKSQSRSMNSGGFTRSVSQ